MALLLSRQWLMLSQPLYFAAYAAPRFHGSTDAACRRSFAFFFFFFFMLAIASLVMRRCRYLRLAPPFAAAILCCPLRCYRHAAPPRRCRRPCARRMLFYARHATFRLCYFSIFTMPHLDFQRFRYLLACHAVPSAMPHAMISTADFVPPSLLRH